MACIITYENKQYTQKEFEQYFKEHFIEFVDNFLGSKQDIEGFKEFINSKSFDKELTQKIQSKLQVLYPEIKLNITNNPVWEQGDNIFNQEEYINQVNYRLKVVSALLKLSIPQETKRTRKYGETTKPGRLTIKLNSKEKPYIEINLRKTLRGKGVTDNQIDFIFDYMKSNGIQEISTEQLALELASKYGYSVEINTAKEELQDYEMVDVTGEGDFQPREFIPDTELIEEEDEDGNIIGVKEVLSEKGKKQIEERENKRKTTQYYSNISVPGGTNYTENEISTPLITPSIKGHAKFSTDNGIGWFRSDEQVTITKKDKQKQFEALEAGIDYKLVQTQATGKTKTRRILEVQSDLFQKGRGSKDLTLRKGIDTYVVYKESPKTNTYYVFNNKSEVLIQSGLTKIEADKLALSLNVSNGSINENQFIQLLNKDNNWVTFFIKSIIQDSAKKGYEKVLFPKGETAAKIEGHETIADEIKNINETINSLNVIINHEWQDKSIKEYAEEYIEKGKSGNYAVRRIIQRGGGVMGMYYDVSIPTLEEAFEIFKNSFIPEIPKKYKADRNIGTGGFFDTKEEAEQENNKYKKELEQRKQELKSTGIEKLKPIEAFYEIKVGNILEKQFGKDNVKTITDEFGNEWREITINQARDLQNILLQRNEANQIIGQANIKALTVLIDAVNQKQDTLPHEYAHHYIAWYRNTPIVQEAIKKWGSEEALVQSIGEQVIKQKGEAYNWWNNFVKWIMNQFNSLSKLQKEELTQILTDAFLTRQDLGSKQDIGGFKEFIQGKQFQKLTAEEKARTIEQVTKEHRSITALKDLSAKLAHRIGGKVRFENRTDADWKGYNQGMTSVLNEAYMTPDTPFHEILAHPIIRAIKGNQLYQNLLKELETGKGKEVFDRIKRDYVYKKRTFRNHYIGDGFTTETTEGETLPFSLEEFKKLPKGIIEKVQKNEFLDITTETINIDGVIYEHTFGEDAKEKVTKRELPKYTLEEQQEEAIVTLLGLMAADKLDAKKDATLISKLKELWKQISDFVKQLLRQDGIIIDELPITTTLNDLAEIMAYGNNHIILPGYKVEYSTPLGNKYDTLEEVNNEIRGLANSDVDVDLSGIKVNKLQDIIDKKEGFVVTKDGYQKVEYAKGQWFDVRGENEARYPINEQEVKKLWQNKVGYSYIEDFIEKNKPYEQAKKIIELWKKINNIQYNPEEVYSRGQGFYSSIGAYSNLELDLLLKNLIQHIKDNKKADGEFTISAFTKPLNTRLKHIEGTGDRVRFVIYPKSNDIKWAAPTDVHSGSVWDAHEKVSKDKKSELLGVSFTKAPHLGNLNKVSPNLADIIDNLSHVHNELAIELTTNNFRLEYDEDVPYSTKKLIDNINSILDQKYGKLVKPEIKKPILSKKSSYNEVLGLEEGYDIVGTTAIQPTQTNETLKESISAIQQNLDSRSKVIPNKFVTKGKHKGYASDTWFYKENGEWYMKYVPFDAPFETKVESHDNVKMSDMGLGIEEVWESYLSTNPEGIEDIKTTEEEYTEQALINLRMVKLKEVARKYPRSLITSKVVPINPNMVNNSEIQYSKVESNSIKDSKGENKVYETDVLIGRFPFSIKGNNTYSVEFINNTSKESYPISVVNDLVYSLNKNNKGKERFVYNPTEKEGYYVINKAVVPTIPYFENKSENISDNLC